jgi:hypothetical protein
MEGAIDAFRGDGRAFSPAASRSIWGGYDGNFGAYSDVGCCTVFSNYKLANAP